MNSSRLRNNLEWSDKITLDQGLEEIFDWINGNFDVLRKMPHEYIKYYNDILITGECGYVGTILTKNSLNKIIR